MTSLSDALLRWYDSTRRDLPWRYGPGQHADPYRVWLAEVMLQQTTTAAVRPYFLAFTRRWPTVAALAAARDDTVMTAWAGLGYYARARNLLKCARVVTHNHGGCFPDTEDALLTLPGVGPYTAAAVAAIAFGRCATVVDGNVERVISRLYAITEPLPGSRPQLRALAEALTPAKRAGDYGQAVMDLGATLCTPRAPTCMLCPWHTSCAGRKHAIAHELPRRRPRSKKRTRNGVAFWATRDDDAVLLRRRPPQGLLGGMMEIPSTPWREQPWNGNEALAHAPTRAVWAPTPGVVKHTFTHFHLQLTVMVGCVQEDADGPGHHWALPKSLDSLALPTVMRKVARLVLEN